MTVRADCTACSTLVELGDNEGNRVLVNDVARFHTIRTGHPVRVFALEELTLHLCADPTNGRSRELEDVLDRRCLPDSDPGSRHEA